MLRIETGMHVAPIKRIGVDRACRIAVTGSDDKTARVWSLPQARLLHTLRVPIGPGNGGKIYAVAMSPDGRWIAAGGWDAQVQLNHQNFVYIFEASTGAMVARVGPFGNVINNLAFSSDGRWLAATSHAEVGLKVIDAQTWKIAFEDKNYGGDSYGAAFAADGRLYTVAFDGKLRQYGPGPDFKKLREVTTKTSKQPFSVAVDPSGQRLAVGFNNKQGVEIYETSNAAVPLQCGYQGFRQRRSFQGHLEPATAPISLPVGCMRSKSKDVWKSAAGDFRSRRQAVRRSLAAQRQHDRKRSALRQWDRGRRRRSCLRRGRQQRPDQPLENAAFLLICAASSATLSPSQPTPRKSASGWAMMRRTRFFSTLGSRRSRARRMRCPACIRH